MLWYKTWLETRSRFLIGLIVLMISAGSTVLLYPELTRLLVAMPQVEATGPIGRHGPPTGRPARPVAMTRRRRAATSGATGYPTFRPIMTRTARPRTSRPSPTP